MTWAIVSLDDPFSLREFISGWVASSSWVGTQACENESSGVTEVQMAKSNTNDTKF
jgi:hypothetical protein